MMLFRIGDGPSDAGPRLGGRSPAGVSPEDATLKYFLTIPLGRGEDELSVFVDPGYALEHPGQIVSTVGVEVVVHTRSQRANEARSFDSTLSPHPLVPIEEVPDEQEENGEILPSSANKFGGRPYLVRRGGELEAKVSSLESAGFSQCLQIDFPGSEDALVTGDWPVGTGIFHLLLRTQHGQVAWRCFWEQ